MRNGKLNNLMVLGFMMSLLLASGVHADEGDGHRGKGKEMGKIYAQLDLTDEQKKLLEENKKSHWDQKKKVFEEMKSLRDAMREELMKSEFDVNKVRQTHAKIKELQGQMADERLEAMLEVRKILTLDQFIKFSKLMEEKKHDFFRKGKDRGEKDKE